jgi:hypothetical protein
MLEAITKGSRYVASRQRGWLVGLITTLSAMAMSAVDKWSPTGPFAEQVQCGFVAARLCSLVSSNTFEEIEDVRVLIENEEA